MLQKMRKCVAMLLIISLFASSAGLVYADTPTTSGGQNSEGDWVYNKENLNGEHTYYYYKEKYKDAAHPKQEISVNIAEHTVIASEYGDSSGTKIIEDGSLDIVAVGEQIVFKADVPETGLYAVELDYIPVNDNKGIQYLFSIRVDGETPFTEANSCVLSRVYTNGKIEPDKNTGDDLRPQATQTPERRTQFLYDQTGTYGTLYFYLEQGEHELSLCFDGTPLRLFGLTLKQEPVAPSYADYLEAWKNKGAKDTVGQLKVYQAETYYRQSSSQLWPDADKSSSLTVPFSYDNVLINYGGGSQWKTPGQWITWEIDVPETGFYNLGLKYRQGYLDGLFSSRKIYIDDEVPFAELNAVRFEYSSGWKNKILGNEDGAFNIYLTKGKHYLRMENVIGDMTATMSVLSTVITDLNRLYLNIVMITSADPDQYRDYDIAKQLPTLADELRANAKLMEEEAELLMSTVGAKGSEIAYFEDVAFNLQSYAKDVEQLGKGKLTKLKNDINGLSAKLTTYQEQALDIDYFALFSTDKKMSKATMNVWQWIVYQVKSFIASFNATDARKEESEETLRVWISTGIDQFEILKNIATEFTSETGIHVNLELAQGSLINALAAGTGPDVMLGVNSETIVNLGLRGAVVDLAEYGGDEYFELLEQYVEGSEIPFRMEGKYYGVPSTNGCTVMFVRTDIFENMGLEIPQTWEDMYDVAQVLQRYNMTLGAAPSFANLLYQKGGDYFEYDEKGTPTKVLFDQDIAIEAMVQHAEFFTKYGFPISYDFANRFRTGEMPIGLADYSVYVNLKYTAPEISGLWEMVPMPGTLVYDENGDPVPDPNEKGGQKINRTQMDNTGVGAIMLKDCENKDAAWELIKWWSGHEVQTRYANDLEACLGISGRRATANLKTLENIGWTQKELNILKTQFKNLKFIPIVPGNYYVTRGVNNSIRGVVDHGENARELMTEWTIKVNDEILRKRNEFNLNN